MATYKRVNCSNEDVPVISGFVLDQVTTDQTELVTVASDIVPSYLTTLRATREVIMELIQPKKLTQDLAEKTQLLYAREDEVRKKVNIIEIQLNRAKANLTKPLKAFGLTKLYEDIRKRNTEGVLAGMRDLIADLEDNKTALMAKGFVKAQSDWLVAEKANIDSLNNQQNVLISQRGELTAANIQQINSFWDEISGLMQTGRLFYKGQPEKRKEYTFAVLKKRVNASHPRKGDVNVNVLDDTNGEPVPNADAKCKKKGLTELTKSVKLTGTDGKTSFPPRLPGAYDLEVTAPNYVKWTGEFTVVAGEVTEVVVKMVRS
jgi:hypothetical protein